MSERFTTSGASLEALGRLLAECNSDDCHDDGPRLPGEGKLLLEQLALPWPPQHGSNAATVADDDLVRRGRAHPVASFIAARVGFC